MTLFNIPTGAEWRLFLPNAVLPWNEFVEHSSGPGCYLVTTTPLPAKTGDIEMFESRIKRGDE